MKTNKTFGKKIVRVAGTTFEKRQNYLWYVRKHDAQAFLMLKRETNNERDPYAVAVMAHLKDTGKTVKIGYLPAKTAFWVAKLMEEGKTVRASRLKDANKNPLPYVIGRTTLGCQFQLNYELPEATPADAAAAPALAEA